MSAEDRESVVVDDRLITVLLRLNLCLHHPHDSVPEVRGKVTSIQAAACFLRVDIAAGSLDYRFLEEAW